MSGKLKLLLTVLALGALVSLSYIFSAFTGSSNTPGLSADALNAAIANSTCQRDTDQDGLSDCEETYWNTDWKNPDTDGDGFKDGEEVLSGHNPTKKGPDDLLNGGGNVTQQAATLILGAVGTGDLDPSSAKYADSVSALSQAVIDRYQANSQVPDEEIIAGGDRRADIIKYGFAASNIIAPALKSLPTGFAAVVQTISGTQLDTLATLNTTAPDIYKKFITTIDQQISQLESEITSLKRLSVPPSMTVGDKNMLKLLRGTQQQYRLLHQIAQDPSQGIFALQSLGNLVSTTLADVSDDFVMRLNNALTEHP